MQNQRTESAVNYKYYIFIAFLVLGFSIIILKLFLSPIYGDEGWFYCAAQAKNQMGYYAFPPYYDVPAFNGPMYASVERLMIQIFRLSILIFSNPKSSIIFVRLLSLIVFISSLFYYLKTVFNNLNNRTKIFIVLLIISYPLIIHNACTGRSDILISSILLLVLAKFRTVYNNNLIGILGLSILMLLLHPNAIIFMAILGIIGINIKKPINTLKLWSLMLIIVLAYYLIFIDYNFHLFFKQNYVLNSTGKEEKFISSISQIPSYFINEIKYRYLIWNNINKIYYPLLLVSLLTPVFGGLFFFCKNTKKYKYELIYIFPAMIFFIFLGEKTVQYLYFLPILIIGFFINFKKKQNLIKIVCIVFTLLFLTILGRNVVWSYNYEKNVRDRVIAVIDKESKRGETIYAPISYGPYFSSNYTFLETTQKQENNWYELYNIHPHNCIIIESQNNEIWQWVTKKREKIAEINNLLIYRIK